MSPPQVPELEDRILQAGDTLQGKVTARSLTIPRGATVTVTDDLELLCTRELVIHGSLVARDRLAEDTSHEGPSMTLVCPGMFTFTGRIQGGRGRTLPPPGIPGGAGSSILVQVGAWRDSGRIRGGAGGTGGPGARGGDGGSVTVLALSARVHRLTRITPGVPGRGGRTEKQERAPEGAAGEVQVQGLTGLERVESFFLVPPERKVSFPRQALLIPEDDERILVIAGEEVLHAENRLWCLLWNTRTRSLESTRAFESPIRLKGEVRLVRDGERTVVLCETVPSGGVLFDPYTGNFESHHPEAPETEVREKHSVFGDWIGVVALPGSEPGLLLINHGWDVRDVGWSAGALIRAWPLSGRSEVLLEGRTDWGHLGESFHWTRTPSGSMLALCGNLGRVGTSYPADLALVALGPTGDLLGVDWIEHGALVE